MSTARDKQNDHPLPATATGKEEAADSGITSLTATPPIPPESYELRILQSIRRIIRAVEISSQQLQQNHQVTGPQLGCLLALREYGPLTATRLAATVFLSPSTVVGIVDRLEEKGLATRVRSTLDRRQVRIELTEAGRRLLATTPPPLQENLAGALKRLPEPEQVSITLALERMVDLMEARQIDAAPVLETGALSPLPRKRPRKPR